MTDSVNSVRVIINSSGRGICGMNADELMKLAKSRLEMFERGILPLHQLVGDLKGIQDSLPDPSPS